MFAPHVSRLRLGSLAQAGIVAVPALLAALGVGILTDWESDVGPASAVVAILDANIAVRLMRAAYGNHGAGAPCRSTGLMGLGLLAVALTAAALTAAAIAQVPGTDMVLVIVGGVTISTAAFLPALLILPGAARTLAMRLRQALDGVSVGICLLFASWLLVISPHGVIESRGFWMALLTCCVLAIAVVTGLRGGGASRKGVVACWAGVCVAIAGLDGLAVLLAVEAYAGWTYLVCAALVGAALLIWYGAMRAVNTDEGPSVDGRVGGAYPVLAVPAAIAIAVALHRLVTHGKFDPPSIMLGLLGILVVALRESIATFDVSQYARRIYEQEARFRNLVAGSTDVIMVLDCDLIVRWQSAAAARQFGLSDQEVVGRHFQSMIHPEDAVYVADRLSDVCAHGCEADRPALIEARLRDGFGRWRTTESSASDQRDVPEVDGIVVHIRDVSERKEIERSLHRLAFADQLTGLANRRQVLTSIAAQRGTQRARGSLLLVALDGFTAINDVRGYDIGDAVLIEVARRLRDGTIGDDLPARLSGDEFAVVTGSSAVQAYALGTRLLTMLAEPITLPGVTVHLTASVGMADLNGGSGGDEVLRRANLALRRAKQLGRGRVEWYDETEEAAMLQRMTLEQDLPDALVRGELDLLYQPILDLVQGRPLAVEALLRWRHPRLGTLLPVDVIPVAEDLGLITEIGDWVLNQAGRQLAVWLREGRNLSMAVNVSPRQLHRPAFVDDVGTILDLHGLPSDRLVIEVAEGGLGVDTSRIDEQLVRVRALGVRTALDEFGAGTDSLTHLRRLPIDMVKLGRSFFDGTIGGPGPSLPIIDVMVGLGRRLGVDICAQGLEAPEHLAVVRSAGCRIGQGHLFARAQPAERVEAYLDGF